MRNKYGLIILVFAGLLLIVEAVLFFAKENVASFFDNQENLAGLVRPLNMSSSKTINDTVLKSTKFQSLKNNVTNFNFNDICKRPNGSVTAIAATSETTVNSDGTTAATSSSSTPENINCSQGNNSPFQGPKVVKQ